MQDKWRSNFHDARSRSNAPFDKLKLRRVRRARSSSEPIGISVPIATYGRDDLLIERTLPNLLNQTFQNFELLVVHDGPSKNLRDRILGMRDSRISYYEVARPRYPRDPVQRWMVAGYRARNLGLLRATKPWVYWISDDDVVLSNAFEVLCQEISTDRSIELLYGDYLAWVGGRYIRKTEGETNVAFPITGIPALAIRRDLSFIGWSGWSYRKSWNRPSDLDMLVRLHAAGVRMRYLPRILAASPPVGNTGLTGSAAHLTMARYQAQRRECNEF